MVIAAAPAAVVAVPTEDITREPALNDNIDKSSDEETNKIPKKSKHSPKKSKHSSSKKTKK
jgi:hypothetical protein